MLRACLKIGSPQQDLPAHQPLDFAVQAIQTNPNSEESRAHASQLTQLLLQPKEIRRKDLILSILHKFVSASSTNRFLLGGGIIRPLFQILSRDDYLSGDASKLILSLVGSLRGEDDVSLTTKLNDFRWKCLETGLPELQRRIMSNDVNAGLLRTVEIVRACAMSTNNMASFLLFESLGELLLEKLGNQTKQDDSVKKALLVIAASDVKIQEKLVTLATEMLKAYLTGQPYISTGSKEPPTQASPKRPLSAAGPMAPIVPNRTIDSGNYWCQVCPGEIVFPTQRDLQKHNFQTHRNTSIIMNSPSNVALFINTLEKQTQGLTALVDKVLGIEMAFLPNRAHKVWQTDDNAVKPAGVNDVMAFSVIISGIMTPELLLQLSHSQLYFYLPFLLKDKRLTSATVTTVTNILHGTPSLAHHFFLFSRINPSTPFLLNCWRPSKKIDRTITWLDGLAKNPKQLAVGKVWEDLNLVDPLFQLKTPVISVELVKIFNSATKPLLLKLNTSNGLSSNIIFKNGDDLRQDYAIQTMFFIFNRLWAFSDMPSKTFIHQYRIVPLGPKMGVMEFVSNCLPSGKYSWKNLNETIASPTQLSRDDKYSFILSMAGSYVACWILGIRDRHQDNMMIKDNKIFFHIDFGFILNEQPGFDAPIFSIPRGIKRHLSQNEWNFFLKVCGDSFAVLHLNFELIVKACVEAMSFMGSVTPAQIRQYLATSLMVGLPEATAKHVLRTKVMEGVASTQKEVKYLMHDIATKIK